MPTYGQDAEPSSWPQLISFILFVTGFLGSIFWPPATLIFAVYDRRFLANNMFFIIVFLTGISGYFVTNTFFRSQLEWLAD
jgi:hypothetical protein